ncbi:MAG: hypothetical protein K2P78_03510, partial [Gemmataceae bacterium]|nr:hypothetical protein [Gemmataceae bacterium]
MTPTARQVAADVLHRSRDRHGFAAELIDDALAGRAEPREGPGDGATARTRPLTGLGSPGLSPQDRRFVTQLVFGVLRRRGTLDALLRPFIRTPLHAVQPRVWDVLHLGAFQLAFLTHVPKHAAVNESVGLAAHVGSPQAKGFVNGVLRRVAELVTDQFTNRPAADAVPFDMLPANPERQRGGERHPLAGARGSPAPLHPPAGVRRFRKLAQSVLPDPLTEPDLYLAAGHSWPRW